MCMREQFEIQIDSTRCIDFFEGIYPQRRPDDDEGIIYWQNREPLIKLS